MDLADDDPAILARALTFMYVDKYATRICPTVAVVRLDAFNSVEDGFSCRNEAEDLDRHNQSLLHTHVFGFADKYDIPQLRSYAKIQFLKAWFGPDVEQGDPASFKRWFDEAGKSVLRAVYTTTPSSVMDLRSMVLLTIRLEQEDHGIVQLPEYRNFYRDVADLGHDLVPYSVRASCCSSCQRAPTAIVGECGCSRVNSCGNEACCRKCCEQSGCLVWHDFGILSYPEDEVNDAITEN